MAGGGAANSVLLAQMLFFVFSATDRNGAGEFFDRRKSCTTGVSASWIRPSPGWKSNQRDVQTTVGVVLHVQGERQFLRAGSSAVERICEVHRAHVKLLRVLRE